ncbi:MAG TPA: ATP-binding protein [Bryobacteraceae bacterium]
MPRRLRSLASLWWRHQAAIVAVAMLAVTFLAYRALALRERANQARHTALAGEAVQRAILAEIAERVRPLERLARFWALRPEVVREVWEDHAAQFASSYTDLQSFQWVDLSLCVRWSAPVLNNARAADGDYASDPPARAAFEAARARRAVQATPVSNLPDGGNAFLVAVPIAGNKHVEGFIAGSLRTTELLHEILASALPEGFRAIVFQGTRQIHSHPRGAAPGPGDHYVDRAFDVYGVPWRVRIWPAPQSLIESQSSLPGVVLLTGLLISVLLTVSVRLANTSRARSWALEQANRRLAAEVAERQQAAAALHQTNETLQSVIGTSPLAIVRASPEGAVTGWNRAAETLLGWHEDEVLGMSLPAAGGEDLERWRVRARAGQNVAGVECTLAHKDGRPVAAELWIARQAAPTGRTAGFICLLADLGPHRQLEQKLRESSKLDAVSRLAAGVAHNFNNLLAIITGYSHMALDDAPPGDPMRAELEQVLKAAERAARLTVQLLAFGRRQPIHPEIVDLNTIIEDLREVLEKIAGEHCELLISPGVQIGQVRIDPQQVEQILVTLVVNAREAIQGGGRIVIETAQTEVRGTTQRRHLDVASGLYVRLSVGDNGPGLDPQVLAHLFEPFVSNKGLGASGLGLSSVYGIAKQNGGGVAALSQPGSGTRIEVYLPRV